MQVNIAFLLFLWLNSWDIGTLCDLDHSTE